ncbi:4-hydroxy-tetrahydrodipicolinate synthase [Aquimarina sp. EL_43]|uniref:4-hydroxy-tetrahydrodipicolinate synthase n=1 Tax=unclassified Aquimarina TaxID=2627091 RepID=UPI0018CAE7A4|nr:MULTISPECIES: 4-hydroxy-tetrahydrodipicolinate synthase [unclassified Aquimarina]MBG6132086.1 4-hydroxy-tetrahydrodipicolinate synthase [Aquimarina sp. EL_35]MBG6152883.1 4-hydroxy-tetrahydrodipicolinate synthase [Aquimarina sp. EL_32]MBG6170890.1 4-hydroxy-tetrahydrodipicolinate synthase [Aquimarina sp. EL_43]
MNDFLRGTGIALATPFNKDGSIDYDGVTSLVNFCIEGNVEYLVVLGTTAESATLSKEEKKNLTAHIVEVNNKRLPLVIGVGGNNTSAVVDEIKEINSSDFDAILSVVPMYNRPSQEGIYRHYKAINDSTTLPVILYNVPSRTATNMTAETTLRLAQLDKIIGIKEAVGDFTQVLQIIKNKPSDFLVISGDDALALPAVVAGGDGVISVVGQGFPASFSEMIRLGLSGETKKAFEKLYTLLPAIDYAFEEGNPAGIKNILKVKGVCEDNLRLPLIPVSEGLAKRIEEFVED